MKDVQSTVRRDLAEQKETYYEQTILNAVSSVVKPISPSDELVLTFNVQLDDGNLLAAISVSINDLLSQLAMLVKSFFTTQLVQIESKFILDPTLEESYVSSNLVTITQYSDGTSHLLKSLALRTYTSQMQPLEQKPAQSLSLMELRQGLLIAKKVSEKLFNGMDNSKEE